MDCSTDLVRIIPMSLSFQVPITILSPTIRDILQVSTFLCCTERLGQGPYGWWVYYVKIPWTPTQGRVVSGCPTRGGRCLPSVVRSLSGEFGAVAGVGPGDVPEGCPLLWGAQDADRVADLERQVCPWVWDHLVPPHDGQDGCPGLAPYAEVAYGVPEEAGRRRTLTLVVFGGLFPVQAHPLDLDRLGGLPQPREEPVTALPGYLLPGDGGVQLTPHAVGEGLGFLWGDPEAGEGLARQLQAGLQLGLHRLVHAEAAEVFQLPGVLGPDQEIRFRGQAPHPFYGESHRKGVGDGQHDDARPTDTGGLQNRYGYGVAVHGGEARRLRLIGAIRIRLNDDERLL